MTSYGEIIGTEAKEFNSEKDVVVIIPEIMTSDIINKESGYHTMVRSKTAITGVLIDSYVNGGDRFYNMETKQYEICKAGEDGIKPVMFNIPSIIFAPAYGEFDRTLTNSFSIDVKTGYSSAAIKTVSGIIVGAIKRDKFMLDVVGTKDVKAINLNILRRILYGK